MGFMQTESVLQSKNRSGPAKNRFSVALVDTNLPQNEKFCLQTLSPKLIPSRFPVL